MAADRALPSAIMAVTGNALVVPVRVDLLVVGKRTVTAGPLADFSRLPFHDGRRDVNPGRPYLGEIVADTPFEEAAAWLAPGVHLHWALPEALTRGRHRPDGATPATDSTAASIDFPRVPNRWLVGAAGGWWVVESDYLHPEGTDASATAVSYLMPVAERVRAPFRYVGRQVPLEDWRPDDPAARYLDGLTAVGWGHPGFHAYYPDCRSVFGFHHPGGVAGPYRVFGWYSRPGDDPVAAYAAAHAGLGDTELVHGLVEQFGWTAIPDDERPVARPTRLLCAGRWEQPGAGSEAAQRRLDHVVLGATGAEALAAHLADRLHRATRKHLRGRFRDDPVGRYEEALESVLLAARLDPARPDAVAALREARHDKEFVGVPGGLVWTVRARSQGLPADAMRAPSSSPGSAPATAVARLAELNRRQHRRDRLDRQQDVLSAQLHSDWCKYQLCTYPPRGSRLDHPDVDELRRHIEVTSLAGLETNFVETDQATRDVVALAAEITDLLAEDDAGACDVAAQDVIDWPGLAAAPPAARLLGRSLAARLARDPTDESLRATVLDALNRAVRGAATPAEIGPDVADPVVRAWLHGRAPDAATTQAIARICRTLFPRPEHAEQAARFAADATEQARAVRTAQRHRAILEWLLPGVLRVVPKARHELDVRPGPRFWRPRDPVLLLVGPAVAPSRRHPRRGGTVFCGVVPLGPDPASGLVAVLDDRGPARSPVAAQIYSILALARDPEPDPGDWHPIMVDWKVALHEEPLPEEPLPAAALTEGSAPEVSLSAESPPEVGAAPAEGERHRYDPDHLTRRYTLRDNRPDIDAIAPGSTTGSPRSTLVVGRSLLSPHPTRELQAALTRRSERTNPPAASGSESGPAAGSAGSATDQASATNPFVDAVVAGAAAHLATVAGSAVHAVSLSGLNAALLMHEPVLPVGIDDPLAFPEARTFAARVARAIGRHLHDAPRPLLGFMPIRAGRLQLVGLRVVDSFGRVLDVPLDGVGATAVHSSEALPAAELGVGGDEIEVFSLPPRLVPPARLRMRWLAAGTPADEAHDHPTTGPVCGWLLPNVLDERIMVHSADGKAVGSVDVPGRWRPAPGEDRIVPPEDIGDPHLRRVVVHLLHRSPDSRKQLLVTLLHALDQIVPDSHAQHRSLGLLMGRPIAVVRASVRLEILGALPVDQSWAELRAVLAGEGRGTAGLEEVRFPLRLGEYGLLDDGLLGFWVERGDGFEDGRFCAPQGLGDIVEPSGMSAGRIEDPVEAGGGHVTLTVDGPTVHLTMLVDPRGSVHATTGILPVKVLRIPPEQYGAALGRIGITFLAAPLLTDPDPLRVALPPEPGHQWSWLERTATGWRETPQAGLGQPRTDAPLAAVQELREGWLRLAPVPEGGGG